MPSESCWSRHSTTMWKWLPSRMKTIVFHSNRRALSSRKSIQASQSSLSRTIGMPPTPFDVTRKVP